MSTPHGVLRGKIEMAERAGRSHITLSVEEAKLLVTSHYSARPRFDRTAGDSFEVRRWPD